MKQIKFVELSKDELQSYNGGTDYVATFLQWLGARLHISYDSYMKDVEKRMADRTAWTMTD